MSRKETLQTASVILDQLGECDARQLLSAYLKQYNLGTSFQATNMPIPGIQATIIPIPGAE